VNGGWKSRKVCVKREGVLNLLPRDVTTEQLGLDPINSDKDTVTG